MRRFTTFWSVSLSILACLLSFHVGATRALAEQVSMTSSKDNTLYEFDPADTNSPFNSNGSGNYFSAGSNRSQNLLRRGLIQFDLSSIPTGATVVPGSVQLKLEVVDAPSRDTSGESRDFWLVPLDRDWGEGTSAANAGVSGSGGGAAATDGDATWLHTAYDSTTHDPRNPNPADPGYWPQLGVLGSSPVDPTAYGAPAGTVPAAPYLGPVTFASAAMEADINAWLADTSSNFGWLVLGDERVVDPNKSSNRRFGSHDHADSPPMLTFEYALVPEPSSIVMFLTGVAIVGWQWRRRL